jgi:phage gp29-like protein
VKTVTEQAPTTQAATTQAATTQTAPSPSGASGSQLNDAGYTKMQAGDLQGALPLLEQAVQKLQGTGSTAEAYADYNLAYTRLKLGNCDGVLDLLVNSESIQGHRSEITRLRNDARKSC